MPNVDKECVTHPYACDCREARMRKLEKIAAAVKAVKAAQFGDMFWQCDAGPLEDLDDAMAALEGERDAHL